MLAGRATIPGAARANAQLIQSALEQGHDAVVAPAGTSGGQEGEALLRLDRRQRDDDVDVRLAAEEDATLLTLCG